MRNMFWNFFRRLFFGAPIDYDKIDRDLAMAVSRGNNNFRSGYEIPDDKKLPSVSEQIEAHFDLSKMR